MADRKITDLTALAAGSQATGDLLTIVDVSEGAAADKNKKITVESLFKGIPSNVGIGGTTVTDSNLLNLQGSSASANIGVVFNDTNTSKIYGIQNGGSALKFFDYTASAERMRIDSSGRLLVGSTSSEYGDANLQVANTSSSTLFVYNSNISANGQARIALGPSNKITGAQLKCIATEDFSVSANRTADLAFETRKDGTLAEAMRIDSSGNVGIGTSAPDGNLHIHDGSAGTITAANSANNLVVENSGAVGMSLLFDDGANNAYGNIYWGNETDGQADGRISYFGSTYTTAADRQAMVFRTANTERMRIQSDGGISFNGDTAAANALDDYEEGTFSVTFTSGISNATYANTGGSYTKIGALVTFNLRIAAAGTNGSGQVQIGTLPFTSSSTKREGGAWFGYRHDLTTGGGPFLHISNGSAVIKWYGNDGVSWAGNNGDGLNNNTFHIQGFYYV